MTASISRPDEHVRQRDRIFWLPAGGWGNGLDDTAWAPVLEISQRIVRPLLGCLRDAGIPAYAAPARSGAVRLRDGAHRPEPCRLWVGASAYGAAETALMDVMPRLTREAAQHSDHAWR